MRFHSVTSILQKPRAWSARGFFIALSRRHNTEPPRVRDSGLGFSRFPKNFMSTFLPSRVTDWGGGGVGFYEGAFASHSLPWTQHNITYAKSRMSINLYFPAHIMRGIASRLGYGSNAGRGDASNPWHSCKRLHNLYDKWAWQNAQNSIHLRGPYKNKA